MNFWSLVFLFVDNLPLPQKVADRLFRFHKTKFLILGAGSRFVVQIT